MKKMMKWIVVAAASLVSTLALLACVPSDLDKAYDKMAMEGYTVAIEKVQTDDGCLGKLHAVKDDEGCVDSIFAYLFDSKGAAQKYYEANKGNAHMLVLDGKWVYVGTEDAIDDFTD